MIHEDNEKLTILDNIIRSNRYNYIYIDDNRIYGTLDNSVFINDIKKIKGKNTLVKRIYFTPLKPVFRPNNNQMILYLIQDEVIAGYIQGSTDTSEINDSYDIMIDYVSISDEHRGKKLCKLITQLFLLNVNLSYGRNLSFALLNIGKEIGCKCYYDAFTENGYLTFFYETNNYKIIGEPKNMTKNLCSVYKDQMISMIFIYRNLSGGKSKKTNL